MASPERWELNQLKNAGALKVTEEPDYDEDFGGILQEHSDDEEDIEIEIGRMSCFGFFDLFVTFAVTCVISPPIDTEVDEGGHRD